MLLLSIVKADFMSNWCKVFFFCFFIFLSRVSRFLNCFFSVKTRKVSDKMTSQFTAECFSLKLNGVFSFLDLFQLDRIAQRFIVRQTLAFVDDDDRLHENGSRIVRFQQCGKQKPDDFLKLFFPPLPDESKLLGEVFVEETVNDGIGASTSTLTSS